jgi:hypothetical protein
MRIWGRAYSQDFGGESFAMSTFTSFAAAENQFASDGSTLPYYPHHALQSIQSSSNMTIANLPRAQDHPLFYVGIYTLIGLATGFTNILSIITQFLGALRASRLLFKRLLVTVIRATMRWHVSYSITIHIGYWVF